LRGEKEESADDHALEGLRKRILLRSRGKKGRSSSTGRKRSDLSRKKDRRRNKLFLKHEKEKKKRR